MNSLISVPPAGFGVKVYEPVRQLKRRSVADAKQEQGQGQGPWSYGDPDRAAASATGSSCGHAFMASIRARTSPVPQVPRHLAVPGGLADVARGPAAARAEAQRGCT